MTAHMRESVRRLNLNLNMSYQKAKYSTLQTTSTNMLVHLIKAAVLRSSFYSTLHNTRNAHNEQYCYICV